MSRAPQSQPAILPIATVIVLSLGALDFGLETSIVLPALPELGRRYGASLVDVGWFATAFQLVAVAAVPLLGRIGEGGSPFLVGDHYEGNPG